MTVLASRSAYDDYDEDYRSDLDSKYEEGFGQGPDLGHDDEDDFDDLFAGLFDDEGDDDDDSSAPAPKRGTAKRAAAKRTSGRQAAATSGKRTTAASAVAARTGTPGAPALTLLSNLPVVSTLPVAAVEPVALPEGLRASEPVRIAETEPAVESPVRAGSVDPGLAALAEAASRARVAAESATNTAKRAVAEAVAKAATARAAAAEASAAEEAAQAALARSTEADAAARAAAERLAVAQAAAVGVPGAEGADGSAGAEGAAGREADPQQEAPAQDVRAEETLAEIAPAAEVLDEVAPAEEAPTEDVLTEEVLDEVAPADEAPGEASALEPAAVVVRDVAPVTDPLYAPSIAPVSEHVDFLRKLRPGLEVPYVDPMHSAEECRIVSLFSNTGAANPSGFVWAGDDAAATRLLGLQYQLGLRPEWIMPWNVYPWFTPGEANGKLDPEQVQAGLKPLLALLKLLPRASAIVAHGPEANRLAQQLLKTGNPLIWRRGLKVYKARSLHGRAFAGSKERQTEWLIEMGKSYADAMARAGVQLRRA